MSLSSVLQENICSFFCVLENVFNKVSEMHHSSKLILYLVADKKPYSVLIMFTQLN